MSNTLTIHAGGTGERQIPINSITVPDLWHVATRLREADNTQDAQLVMDCWHLAHAMKDHLQAMDAAPHYQGGEPALERVILQRKESTRDQGAVLDSDIILAFVPDNHEPFITWVQVLDQHDEGRAEMFGQDNDRVKSYTISGHYFMTLREALDDFDNR
jgi:hypothetical protein